MLTFRLYIVGSLVSQGQETRYIKSFEHLAAIETGRDIVETRNILYNENIGSLKV